MIPSWLWIVFTLTASSAQTARNAMQRDLTEKLGTQGATYVRFLFGFPFAILFTLILRAATGEPFPRPGWGAFGWAFAGATTQMAATALMLRAMRDRSFLVTIAYTKTEPILVALFSIAFLGETPTSMVAAAIGVATAGVLLMSWPKSGGDAQAASWRPALIGLGSGACFGLSATCYRGCVLALASPSFIMTATVTLSLGLLIQCVLIVGWLVLRDRALLYNPDDPLIYRELAWFFQHKMGQNLDDANNYYKILWKDEMTPYFGPGGTNFESMIHPQTAVERTNAMVLREKFKIDPVFAKKVDADWGPLDWRLPEAHAIYWAALGLERAKEHPGKVKAEDLKNLRRVIYQTDFQAFKHGRIVSNPFTDSVELAPNLDLVSRANDAYLFFMNDDPGTSNNIANAHRNFLRDAIYFLYENNRMAGANKWFKYLGEHYPDKPIIENQQDSLPNNLTLDEYVVAVVNIDIKETSQDRVTSAVQGFLAHAYLDMAIGQDDRAVGYQLLAKTVYDQYQKKMRGPDRASLPPLPDINKTVLAQLLDAKDGLPFAARAVLRTQLRMPAETNAPPQMISSNAIAPAILSRATNSSATNSTAK